MLKKITLSVDEELIKKAREKAHRENTTLNDKFREWLKQYIMPDKANFNYDEFMNSLSYANPGRKFTRDDLNKR